LANGSLLCVFIQNTVVVYLDNSDKRVEIERGIHTSRKKTWSWGRF